MSSSEALFLRQNLHYGTFSFNKVCLGCTEQSDMCDSLPEEQTDHARKGNDLFESPAELQRVSGGLKDAQETGSRLAEKPRQQQTHYQ